MSCYEADAKIELINLKENRFVLILSDIYRRRKTLVVVKKFRCDEL